MRIFARRSVILRLVVLAVVVFGLTRVHDLGYAAVTAVAFIAILGSLVLIHELGHFLTARLFGVRVEEFGLGFPPRVYPSKEKAEALHARGKTIYSLNALPLGGFVRLAGENGVVSATDVQPSTPGAASLSGNAAPEDDPHAFANKPAWQRAVILAAGAFNNMVLAIVLVFVTLAFIGTPQAYTEVTKIALGSPAERGGLQPGDRIIAVGGKTVASLDDVHNAAVANAGKHLSLTVRRGVKDVTVTVVPRLPQQTPGDQGAIGLMTTPVDPHNVPASLGDAATTAIAIPVNVVQGVWALIDHPANAATSSAGAASSISLTSAYITFGGQHVNEATNVPVPDAASAVAVDPCAVVQGASGGGVTGPIGIIRQVGCEANNIGTVGWTPLLSLVVDLTATLAIVNLLPFPALDGGRLVFVLIALVTRRKVRPRTEALVHALGMAALLSLMLVISVHDVTNWFSGAAVYN